MIDPAISKRVVVKPLTEPIRFSEFLNKFDLTVEVTEQAVRRWEGLNIARWQALLLHRVLFASGNPIFGNGNTVDEATAQLKLSLQGAEVYVTNENIKFQCPNEWHPEHEFQHPSCEP